MHKACRGGPRLRLLLLFGALAFQIRTPALVRGVQLTGVNLYSANDNGEPIGAFWHTSLDPSGQPIGFTRWIPQGIRNVPFANRDNGEIVIELVPAPHIATLFWQYKAGEFPDLLALNLFFNGDNLNPGISVLVPHAREFTVFRQNLSPTALSLYGRDVENSTGPAYDDGQSSIRLGAAFYFASGVGVGEWRPSDLVNLDRVGDDRLTPDGNFDGILVFEVVVSPSTQRPASNAAGRPPAAPVLVEPLQARIGADQWDAHPGERLESGPVSTRSPAGASSPGPISDQVAGTPTNGKVVVQSEESATPEEMPPTQAVKPLAGSESTPTAQRANTPGPGATRHSRTGEPTRVSTPPPPQDGQTATAKQGTASPSDGVTPTPGNASH